MLDLNNCNTLNDIARKIFGIANYNKREKVKKILFDEGIDWKIWLSERKVQNKETIKCICCNKEFELKYKNQKFCSQSCAATYNNSNRIFSEETRNKISKSLQERNINFEGVYKPLSELSRRSINRTFGKEECKCLVCGKELTNKRSIYCSNKCQQEYHFKEFIKKWQNGKENGIVGEYGISIRIRKYLFEKYDNKCQLCGWGEKNIFTDTIPLEIHHIDGDYTNNKEENLQLLCPNCHSLTETHKSHNKKGRQGRKKYYKN